MPTLYPSETMLYIKNFINNTYSLNDEDANGKKNSIVFLNDCQYNE